MKRIIQSNIGIYDNAFLNTTEELICYERSVRVSQNHHSHWLILFLLLVCSLLILKRIHHFVSDETFVTALLNTPYLVTIHRVKKSIPLLTSAEEIQPHIPVLFFLTVILLWVIILLVWYFLTKWTCIVYVAYLLFIIFTLYRDIFKWQLQEVVISSLHVLCGMSKPDKAFKSGRGGQVTNLSQKDVSGKPCGRLVLNWSLIQILTV